ncbi:hypothetical protein T10_10642 [Trichinella papuae]|uniref:Uncharacterized protein n=1 Tax=Trichinella papuae TaxID=268474 RepID=A0A0V1M6B2_9BILA|nr:hypothetical protein T10_10642 [Trichinella papuae]
MKSQEWKRLHHQLQGDAYSREFKCRVTLPDCDNQGQVLFHNSRALKSMKYNGDALCCLQLNDECAGKLCFCKVNNTRSEANCGNNFVSEKKNLFCFEKFAYYNAGCKMQKQISYLLRLDDQRCASRLFSNFVRLFEKVERRCSNLSQKGVAEMSRVC